MESLAARIILLWGWRRACAAFAAGALSVLAQPPFDFFPVCFVSYPVLVWLLDGATPERGSGLLRRLGASFGVGWWFGFGAFLAGLWWIGNALLVEAAAFAWALPLAVVGIPALLAVFYGVGTAVSRLVWSDGIARLAALAFGLGLAEWLRSFVLTGFPWNAAGQAAMPVPLLMQSVSVVGVQGMNALAVFVFALPALLAQRRHRIAGLAAGLALVAAHVGFGVVRLQQAPAAEGRALSVRIVQPAVEQQGKWDPAQRERIVADLLEFSARPPAAGRSRPDLIVWPETALPFLLTDRPDALSAIGAMLGDGQKLLLGAVRSEGDAGRALYYNSVIAVDDVGQIVDAADKVHLVPFGEYLPFGDLLSRLGLTTVAETVGGFSAGSSRRTIEVGSGIAALPLICYEIIFPGAASSPPADLIVNVTNDAWFGRTPGPYQHFRQAQIRAVESGLPLIRAANNGISAVVDERGRVVDALDLDERGTLDVSLTVPPRAGAASAWTWLNGFLILLFFATIACGVSVGQRLRSV